MIGWMHCLVKVAFIVTAKCILEIDRWGGRGVGYHHLTGEQADNFLRLALDRLEECMGLDSQC